MILSLIGVVLLVMIWLKGSDEAVAGFQSVMDWYMYVAYIMLAIVLLFVLIFVLKGIIAGNVKKTLMIIGAFVLIVIIGYAMATGVETKMKDGEILSVSSSKWVGAGLYTFYILAIIAVGTMIFSEVKKTISK